MVIVNKILRYDKYDYQDVILEQPISGDDIDGLAWITKTTPIRILVDDPARTPRDVFRIVQKRAADIISIKVSKAGGIYKALQSIAIAEAANYPYVVDEIGESKVANTAVVYLALVAKDMVYAGGAVHTQFKQDIIEEGGVKVSEGWGRVPDSPGLGIKKLRNLKINGK